jgi:hypothetical protein
MDTVFVLQLIFLGVCIMAIVFYFKRTGQVGTLFTYYVSGITLILISMLTINRVFFTSARRDPRHWHRFRFEDDGRKVPSKTTNPGLGDLFAAFMHKMPAAPAATCPACPPA